MATVNGSSGNDWLTGTNDNDVMYGGAGNDTLMASWGIDTVYGGSGNDVAYGGSLNDTVTGEAGNDYIEGSDGSDNLTGGQGFDTIYGGIDNDLIIGDGQWYSLTASSGTTATNLTITNSADGPIELWWVNTSGTLVFYGTIQAGQTFTQPTFVGHKFMLRDTQGYYLEAITAGTNTTVTFGPDMADLLHGDDGNDTILAQYGNDTVSGGAGADTIYGGDGNDSLFGDDLGESGSDVVYGGAGNDTLVGNELSDTLYGGEGDDYIYGGYLGQTGGDSLDGGVGIDTVDYSYSNAGISLDLTAGTGAGGDADGDTLQGFEVVYASGLDDQIFGGAANETLYGLKGADLLAGGTGADVIYGDDDADTIYGGAGDTVLGGEGGIDSDVLVLNWPDVESITYGGGTNEAGTVTFTAASGGGTLTFSEIETIHYTGAVEGTSGADNIGAGYVDGQGDAVDGVDGDNDIILAGDGNDTVSAGAGNDIVFGADDVDLIYGGAGDDQLYGGLSNDTIFGGTGNDTVFVFAGDMGDTIFGGENTGDNDILSFANTATTDGIIVTATEAEAGFYQFGGSSFGAWGVYSQIEGISGTNNNDTINVEADGSGVIVDANDGDDSVVGGAGNDTFYGGNGNDTLRGGLGQDELFGDSGNDSIFADDGDDTVFGGIGNDTILSGNGNDISYGGDDDDYVGGGEGSDQLFGGAGNDTVNGGAGVWNDSLYGGDGDDRVIGSLGADFLDGDAGNDTLRGGAGNDSLYGGDGIDHAVFTGPVSDYSFDYGPAGELIVTDTVADRDGTDTLTGFEYVEFGGVTYHLVTGDDGSNTTLQGPNDATPSLIIAHDGADWGGGHPTSDVIFGGAGDDTLDGGDGDDTLLGEDGNDLLRGDAGNDSLIGGAGADTLDGCAGDDTLVGDTGDDLMTGGEGADSLTGGDGADTYLLVQNGGADTISDFDMTLTTTKTVDQLDVSALRTPSGDPIAWRDVLVSDTVGDGSGDAVLTFPNGESVVLQGVSPTQVDSKQEMAAIGIPCFVAGTKLLTTSGWRAVETVRAGDYVLTTNGPEPVIWAGHRRLGADDLAQNPESRPVYFPSGAIGNNAALRLSPQHAVLMHNAKGERVLVRAKHLAEVGFGKARVLNGTRSVSYHHILLRRHAIVSAAGAMTESFYPGPQAMAMLDWPSRLAVTAAVGADTGVKVGLSRAILEQHYGERVHPLVGRNAIAGLTVVNEDLDLQPFLPIAAE